MAKMERILHGDFNEILGRIENGIAARFVCLSGTAQWDPTAFP